MKTLLVLLLLIPSLSWGGCENGDCENGYGTYVLKNGDKYKGEFKNGDYNGYGTYESKDFKYVGEFKNNLMDGQGITTWSSGIKYVGGYKNNLMDGQGITTWSNGSKYIGGYKKNTKHGQGIFIFEDGTRKVGEWKNNVYIKQVTSTFTDVNKSEEYIGQTNKNYFIEEEYPRDVILDGPDGPNLCIQDSAGILICP